MLTLEEAAETFRRLLPLGMSAHQALNLMNPVGKALAQKEDEAVKALFEEAVKSKEEGSGGQAHHVIEHPHMCLASIEPASWWGVVVVGSDAREIWGLMSPMGQMSPMGLMGQRGPIGQMGLMSPMSPMGLMGQRSPIGRCMRIEASCQTVVTTRLKRAGMCWTPEGLDAILPLRTSMLNRTYDDFWEHRSRLVA